MYIYFRCFYDKKFMYTIKFTFLNYAHGKAYQHLYTRT